MKKLSVPGINLFVFGLQVFSQIIDKKAPQDFEETGQSTADGKYGAVACASKTVGTTREAVIYTHHGFSMEKKYPVLNDREHRAIAGLSMGDGQVLNFGLGNPDEFARVGSFSSSPNTKMPEELVPDPEGDKKQLKQLWISAGGQDYPVTFSKLKHDYLTAHQVPHLYHVIPGGYHDINVWKDNLYLFFQLLFTPVDESSFSSY